MMWIEAGAMGSFLSVADDCLVIKTPQGAERPPSWPLYPLSEAT